ncbi:HEPN domain-containing protein [Methanofollis formosanus]|uniref:HEPN domain-containing protein n=1 Tax=Methanofollis formosanus TaxID=299308 RepID=A0A8G1EGI9_9EURY|nr:HEPN domain-containing protein [Methanofollis formosanus]QYZ79845.1 HEPN domain-containing protein [Methanofollis formosanus]
MKTQNFLNKLFREGKIRVVDPSVQVQEAYRKKSESYLISAKILLENGRLEETVSMAYYSMYYMVLALLFKTGIKCENHTGAMILLERLYGIDSSRIAAAKRDRIDKQYYVDFAITAEEVKDSIEEAEAFCADLLDFMERLHQGEISRLREEAVRLQEGS